MKNSDLISREALLRKAQALLSFDGKEVVWVRDDVLLAPTIDPVHAAGACYCRECSYWKRASELLPNNALPDFGYCSANLDPDTDIEKQVSESDFCSYGERRTE